MAYPTYDEFVSQEARDVDAAYRKRWAHAPGPSDLYHNAWRRLSPERWTHRDIVADILGLPLQDGGAGGDLDDGDEPTPPGPSPPVTSIIRPYGSRSVRDDGGGAVLQVTLSDFSLLRLYRQDREATRQRLREHAERGFTAARCLGQVTWGGEKAIDHHWPDHLTLVANLTTDAAAAGLRLEWTLIGGGIPTQAERRAYVRDMAQTLSAVPHGVLFVEIANEPLGIGPLSVPELRELVTDVQRTVTWPALVSPGVVTVQHMREAFPECVMTQHLDRDTSKSELQDRPWRQAWEFGLEGLRWCDNEPIGHQSSISSETRPDVLRSHRLVAFISRAFASCLHCTPAGVYADVPWTSIPAYDEVGKCRRFLPGHLAEGVPYNANPNFPGHPFDIDPSLLRANNNNTAGVVRLYANECDGVFYVVPFGLVSDIALTSRFDFSSVQCCSQRDGVVLWERGLQAGETVPLPQATDHLLICRR